MRRKKKGSRGGADSEPPAAGWEIIYSGFVLILLSFFIMLASFSTMQQERVMRFVQSFSNALSIFSGGLSMEPGREVLNSALGMVDKNSDLAGIYNALKGTAGAMGLADSVDIVLTGGGVVMRLPDKFLFQLGSADISPAALPLLKRIAQMIRASGFEVSIQGHTDDLPIHNASFPSNWELSTARAVTVLRYFCEAEGIDSQRLSAVGMGEYHPLEPNDSDGNRARNRRVEIVFTDPRIAAGP